MKPIDYVFDMRKAKVVVGSAVCYLKPPEIRQDFDTVHLKLATVALSKVKSMEVSSHGGFAEVGAAVRVTLEDESVHTGDSENGGWMFLKLADS